ncbi:MAG: regulatory protein MarR [Clostridiales bacterium]|jgi:DNA-binding MarR family transcriptional regulator|nr:regulatory protein MarR [Clostridiales bacterium]
MKNTNEVINGLIVNMFNNLLVIEKNSLAATEHKDLTMTEWHVLEQIGLTRKTMTEVANQLKITVGTLTTTINRLVKKDYVTRNQAVDDRRFVYIELTRKGQLAFKEHELFHKNMVKSVVDKLDESDNEVLINSIDKLTQFFKQQYKDQIIP